MVAWSLLVSIMLYERVGLEAYRIVLFAPYILAIPIIAVVMKKMFQFSGPVERSAALAGAGFPGAGLDRLLRRRAVDGDAAHHLAGIGAGHHPVPRATAQPRRGAGRGGTPGRRILVAAGALRVPAADEGGHRVLRGGQRHHHAVLRLRLHLHDGRRTRRARHLDDGAGALHLQRADQDQPARHRLRRFGAAVPRIAAADRSLVRGPAAGQ